MPALLYNFFMDLILASASPRRREILSKAGYKFKVVPSDYEEKILTLNYNDQIVKNCAYNKALDVFKKNQNSLIIASDTVVVLDNIILGKPKDKTDAFKMLKALSNKKHFVATSICLMNKNNVLGDIQKTFVTFKKLSDDEINNYLNSKKPFDKAGSYGIQDDGFDFAINIQGDIDNVIGFPMRLFDKMFSCIS